ncbi:type II toxin-antitoxin system VapC family toxin [Nocardioides sp. NPDC101246]|uniref:type II toxin-antitoxin system VapC family toxin n=1 Tax=Nocardioides sp. NPDC101246 TaxID=3364336 RepID=UPI003826029D
MLAYVDTSAAAKLLLDEPERSPLRDHLRMLKDRGDRLISSDLLDVELARVCVRLGIDQAMADRIVASVHRMGILPEVIEEAKEIKQVIKSLDSIHLATALLLADEAEGEEAVEQFLTYDVNLARVAEELGFEVVSPGRR